VSGKEPRRFYTVWIKLGPNDLQPWKPLSHNN
jgi:hypothetical protein